MKVFYRKSNNWLKLKLGGLTLIKHLLVVSIIAIFGGDTVGIGQTRKAGQRHGDEQSDSVTRLNVQLITTGTPVPI